MTDIKKLIENSDTKECVSTQTVFFGGEAYTVEINKTISLLDYNSAATRIEKWCFYDNGTGDVIYMPELMHCGLVLECTKVFTNIDISDVDMNDAYVFLCNIDILDLIEENASSQYQMLIKAVEERVKHRLDLIAASKSVTQKLSDTLDSVQGVFTSFKEVANSINLENLEGIVGDIQKSMTPENIKLVSDTLKALG